MILAGDVGGTKTVLGLFKRVGGALTPTREATFASADFSSLEAIFQEFLPRRAPTIQAVAVGVAGPVVDGRSRRVNLPWPVDRRRLARGLDVERVSVINDLEATALGIPALSPKRMHSLTPRLRSRAGNAALIAAGTGLGMAQLIWDGERYHASASEGGHTGFAPRDDLEIALLRHLQRRYERVSTERVVSGDGIASIYDFLAENGWGEPAIALRAAPHASEDRNAKIGRAALAGTDRLAVRALEMFVSLYGAAAGDLALTAKATAGVYVGGGIAPRILPLLASGEFVKAFRAKGRLGSLLEKIPVRVILEPRTALLGAAAHAARQAAGSPTRRVRKKR